MKPGRSFLLQVVLGVSLALVERERVVASTTTTSSSQE